MYVLLYTVHAVWLKAQTKNFYTLLLHNYLFEPCYRTFPIKPTIWAMTHGMREGFWHLMEIGTGTEAWYVDAASGGSLTNPPMYHREAALTK